MQGATLFSEQLASLNFEPKVDGEWVEFKYLIPGGTYAGKEILLAINPPPNFPLSPPGGIHFSPRLRPLNQNAQHPDRSHKTDRFHDGEYWSRPYPDWAIENNKNASAYMAYVNNLWITT